MKKSFTYYITLWVIQLKGLKKNFSEAPINYEKIRKEDVHFPKNRYFKQNNTKTFSVLKTIISEITPSKQSDQLLIFIHGGAFISGPSQHHWDTVEKIAKQTTYTIWMCNYPKAPENKILEISENMDEVYNAAIQKFKPENITLIGDSVGATLIMGLTQRLIQKNAKCPSKIILISPVVDATFENPLIDEIERRDPILSKKGVLSAKLMCVENGDLTNPMISPIYGSFENFPETFLFMAEHDITYPDQQLLAQKLNELNIKNTVFFGKEMPHIWPFLPVMKEAKWALNSIITILKAS